MPLATGSVLLGKYQIEQLLGEGGFGYVYRATDQSLGRAVAVKELKPEAGQDAQALQRFLQEARAAAALNHPNIVTIHALETHGGYFIIMEFMAGGSLDNLLRQRPDHRLTPQEAVGVIAAVCDGLAAAHGLGIVHRDIKPSNILFTADGRPKLTDFGIAHVPTVITGQAGLTQTGLALGTVLYMAPEQSRGRRVDGRVDLYALGVVLYEAILGRRYLDFEADNQLRNLDLIATQPPIPPRALDPTLSRTLEQVMLRALAKDPARRYQTAQEIGTALLSLSPRALVTPTRPITPLRPIPGVKLPTPSPVSPRPGVPPQPVSPRAPVSPPVSPRTPTSPPVSPPRPAAAPTVALPPPLPGTEVTAPPAAAPPAEQAPTPLPVPAGVPPAIMPSMGQEAVVVPSLRKLYPLLALAGVVVVMLLLVGLVWGAGHIGPGPAITPLFTPTMTATKKPPPTVTLALIPAAITRTPIATPTPTLISVPPTATPTPTPSGTPTPTYTSIPTATPTSTPSYTPVPTPVPPTPVPPTPTPVPTTPLPTPSPPTPTKTLPPPLPTPTKTLPPPPGRVSPLLLPLPAWEPRP